MKVWPGLEEFREGVPLLWREEEQALLPPSTICEWALSLSVWLWFWRWVGLMYGRGVVAILDAQKKKFGRDFEKVKKLGFEFTRDEYIYAWLIGMWSLFHHSPSLGH